MYHDSDLNFDNILDDPSEKDFLPGRVDIWSDSAEDFAQEIEEYGVIDPNEHLHWGTNFITGPAGTGKTYQLLEKMRLNPNWGYMAATTGIAAINLNTITINSLLKYFDTDSLMDSFTHGRLTKQLRKLGKGSKNIAIDEISMMDGEQLDLLVKALGIVNNTTFKGDPIHLTLTGDFCQLPPVKAKWAFEAEAWPLFERSTSKLEKIWRQDNPKFLEGINLCRAGDGAAGVKALVEAGVTFTGGLDMKFEGTTIMAKNDEVNRYNEARMLRLPTKPIIIGSDRWGKAAGEWKLIPGRLVVKEKALVMILANDAPDFKYANGDLAHVIEFDPDHLVLWVELVRNKQKVGIPRIIRRAEENEPPRSGTTSDDYPHWSEWVDTINDQGEDIKVRNPSPRPWGQHYYDPERKKFIGGEVKYMPVRLAYATTVHKSQGLSLDTVQLDPRGHFFGAPGMAYVALSRARNPEGLRIVGEPGLFARRVTTDPKVKRWL